MKLFSFLLLCLILATSPKVEAAWVNQVCDYFFAAVPRNPFSHALPPDAVIGSLTERAKSFQELYPDSVKLVDDVILEMETTAGKFQQTKKVLVVSIPSDEALMAQFLADYNKYFSHNAISFSGGGHLYTKVGTKTLDHLSKITEKEYYISKSDHFETIVQLSDQEFQNLKTYAHYSTKKYKSTVGKFEYEGPMTAKGAMTNNCGVGKGHNCTSWITLAPIGENAESLKQLIGASTWDVHRNPGWWQTYLGTKANNERVPFVVYFSTGPMNTALEKIKPDAVIPMGYGLR